jgi:hypothetical protein
MVKYLEVLVISTNVVIRNSDDKLAHHPDPITDFHADSLSFQEDESIRLPRKRIEILDLEQVCWHRFANILGEKNLVKSLLISTVYKVIYFIGTFYRAQQNLSSLHKIGWRSAEKIAHIFQHASSRSKISMRKRS